MGHFGGLFRSVILFTYIALLFNYNKSYASPYSTIRSYWKSICRIVIWTRKCSRSQPVYYFYKRYFPSIICCIDKNIIEKHVFSRCWSIHNYWNICCLTYITYLKRKWIRIGRINVCLTILFFFHDCIFYVFIIDNDNSIYILWKIWKLYILYRTIIVTLYCDITCF